jgi:hypothetical protein
MKRKALWYDSRIDFLEVWNAASGIDAVATAFGLPLNGTPEQVRFTRQRVTKVAHSLRQWAKAQGTPLKRFAGEDGRSYNAGPHGPRKPRVETVQVAGVVTILDPEQVAREALDCALADARAALAGGIVGFEWKGMTERLAGLLHVEISDAGQSGGRRWTALTHEATQVGKVNSWQRAVTVLVRWHEAQPTQVA